MEPNVKVTDLGDELEKELKDTDILVNTTPIGMYPNISQKPIVTADMMHEELVVNDIVYNPLKTGIERSRKSRCKTISGVKMLIYQGVEAFKIWTGIEPPIEVFKRALMNQMNLEII